MRKLAIALCAMGLVACTVEAGSEGDITGDGDDSPADGIGTGVSYGPLGEVDGQWDSSYGDAVIHSSGDHVVIVQGSYIMDLQRQGNRLYGRWCGSSRGSIELGRLVGGDPDTLNGRYRYEDTDDWNEGWDFNRSSDTERWDDLHQQATTARCD